MSKLYDLLYTMIGKLNSSVKTTAQTLTDAEKTQARANIGAQPAGDYAKKTDIPSVPTKVSAFTNDVGYLTQHQDLSAYAKKTEIPSKLPNPHALTINGKTYDGASAVSIKVEGGSGGAQADWKAARGLPGHVLNRTHWVDEGGTVLLDDDAVGFADGSALIDDVQLVAGASYIITYNGETEKCVAVDDGLGSIMLRPNNLPVDFNYEAPNDEMGVSEAFRIYPHDFEESEAAIKIVLNSEIIHPLDKKFLPDDIGGGADWNATEGEPGHVLNRTHWVDADGTVHKMDKMFLPDCIDGGALFGTTEKQIEVLPETDVQFYHDGYQYARKKTFENMPDKVKLPFPELSYGKYIVYWRDVPYECAVQCANGSNPDGSVWKRTTLGNVAGLKNTEFAGINMGIDSGEPFLIDTFFVYTTAGTISYITFYRFDDTDTEEFVPVQIFLCETAINKMPTKYLPDGVPCCIEGSATDTLTFDGNIEGREVLDLGEGMYFVKVSDAFVEGAELNGGTLTLVRLGEDASNETIVITEDMIMDVSSTFGFPAYVVGEFIYIMSQALTQDGMTLGKGIHFMCAPDEFYVSELKAPSAVIVSPGIVQTLDSRCLPDDATVFHLTSPNGTKYAITVGDSGAITATEVT